MCHKAYAFDWTRFAQDFQAAFERALQDAEPEILIREISSHDELPGPARSALIGFPLGPESRRFDPGLMGSYFQTPELLRTSLATLATLQNPTLSRYLDQLRRASRDGLELYITF